jgi:hypothetical protein
VVIIAGAALFPREDLERKARKRRGAADAPENQPSCLSGALPPER